MADIRLNPRNKAEWQALGYLLQFSKKKFISSSKPSRSENSLHKITSLLKSHKNLRGIKLDKLSLKRVTKFPTCMLLLLRSKQQNEPNA